MFTEAYILSNSNLYSGITKLLKSKLWYDFEEIINTYEKLKRLEITKENLKKETNNGEKSKLNFEIKTLIQELGRVKK